LWQESKSRFITSFEIVKYDDAYVELLEVYPCDSKKELDRREGQLIRQNVCVNKIVPGRSWEEYKEENRERLAEIKRADRERIAEYHREYYVANSDIITARARAHYAANKESISHSRAQKTMCECGDSVSIRNIARHLKTERHALLLEEKCQAIL